MPELDNPFADLPYRYWECARDGSWRDLHLKALNLFWMVLPDRR